LDNAKVRLKRPIIQYNSLLLWNNSACIMKLNRIKTVLAEKGISQTWLAKKLGKSFSMVNAYACNRSQPNLDTLQQIAEILQVDLKELITDKEER
jgi:putative transcriptional regulator